MDRKEFYKGNFMIIHTFLGKLHDFSKYPVQNLALFVYVWRYRVTEMVLTKHKWHIFDYF